MSVFTVPNVSSLKALHQVKDGDTCYVRTLRSSFILDMTSTNWPDDITVVVTQSAIRIGQEDLPGRWLRLPTAHPSWLRQKTWYISPLGNDENDGSLLTTPLRTHAELARRWGPDSPTLVWDAPSAAHPHAETRVTVFLMGNLDATDPITIKVTLGNNTSLLYVGTPTQLGAIGHLADVTKKVPAQNIPWSVKGQGRTLTSKDVGKRLRITECVHPGAPHIGQFAWVAKADLPGAPGAARMSNFAKLNFDWGAFGLFTAVVAQGVTSGEVVDGDGFVVEELTEVWVDSISIDGPQAGADFAPAIGFVNIAFRHLGPDSSDEKMRKLQIQGGVRGIKAVFMGCSWSGTLALSSDITRHWYLNCRFQHLALTRVGAVFLAGLCVGEISYRGGLANFDDDFMCQGGVGFGGVGFRVQSSGVLFGSVCSFDSSVDGFHLGQDSALPCSAACFNLGSKPHLLWGAGNARYGVNVAGGSVLAYQSKIPVVTGVLGDFVLAGSTAKSRGFNDATGLPTPVIPNTWLNLAADIGAGGFGKSAHNFARDASIVRRDEVP